MPQWMCLFQKPTCNDHCILYFAEWTFNRNTDFYFFHVEQKIVTHGVFLPSKARKRVELHLALDRSPRPGWPDVTSTSPPSRPPPGRPQQTPLNIVSP